MHEDKTYNERLLHFATAPRATTKEITQMVDGDFVSYYGGRLRGKFVKMDGKYKFDTKQEALYHAREFRRRSKKQAKEKGLL